VGWKDAPVVTKSWRDAPVVGDKPKKMERPAFEVEAEKTLSYTPAELIAGSAPVRFALGAAAPIMGAAQFGAELLGDKTGTETLKRVEDLKRRGMEAYGQEGMDVAGLAGATMSPAVLKVAKAIKPAAGAFGRIGQGAAAGTGFGAATPVVEGDDFWGTKAWQAIVGGATGAAVPAGGEALKGGGRVIRDLTDMFTESGAGRILTRYQRNLIGDKGRQSVVDALRNAPEHVPGAKPTAAEAVSQVPAGSPIVAHQRITAGTPGGPSAAFGERVLERQAARAATEEARNAATGPMREAALSAANAGGVRADSAIQGIDDMLAKPGLRASDVVGKTLNSIKEKIARFANENGVIDANDLYTIRKEIGNTIKQHSKDSANWDKRLAAGLERDIQRSIDDAIEAAGGKGWKQYLEKFAQMSRGLEDDAARVKASLRPPQKTNLGGGMQVAEESRLHLPQMLSRPMMVANAVLSRVGKGIEPRIDAEATRRYLNPEILADALADVPAPQRQAIVEALMQARIPVTSVLPATAAAQAQ